MDNLIEQYKEKHGKKPDLEQLQKFYNEQNGIPEPTKQSRVRTDKTLGKLSLDEINLIYQTDRVCYDYMAANPNWTLTDFADRYYPIDL